jgi:integrase
MAAIRKRGKRYHVQVRITGYPSRTASFKTEREAKRWAATVEAEMIEGRHFRSAQSRRRTLKQAIERYLEDVVPEKRDGEMHRTCGAWWKEQLGDEKLAFVTPELVIEYRDKLRKKKHRDGVLSNARVNRYIAVLRNIFSVARKEWHWIAHNPLAGGVAMLPEGKGRVRYLSDDERKVLLAETAKDPILHTFVMLALSTACRAGELQKLEWRDVDLKAGRLLFRDTKNAQPRTAWVSGAPLDLLTEHGKVRKLKGGLVFESRSTKLRPGPKSTQGKSAALAGKERPTVSRYDYSRPFRAAVKAAEIENFRFHDLRHSAATYLAQAGATEQQLRAIGGWKSNIVSRYVHLAAEDAKGALEKLVEKIEQ